MVSGRWNRWPRIRNNKYSIVRRSKPKSQVSFQPVFHLISTMRLCTQPLEVRSWLTGFRSGFRTNSFQGQTVSRVKLIRGYKVNVMVARNWKLFSERFLNQFGDQNNEATIASGFTYRPSSSYDGTQDTCDWIFTHSNIDYKVKFTLDHMVMITNY